MSAGTGRQNIIILFWKYQFHFWEYINGNQTLILDSHRPFIAVYNMKLLVDLLYKYSMWISQEEGLEQEGGEREQELRHSQRLLQCV